MDVVQANITKQNSWALNTKNKTDETELQNTLYIPKTSVQRKPCSGVGGCFILEEREPKRGKLKTN